MLDVLIHNGRVIDGTGSPWFHAGVGIEEGRIRILRGDLSSIEAARNIDADGMVVCPGFIDMHTHSGLMLLHEPRNEPKIHQGITTELIGVDGNSYAPLHIGGGLRPVPAAQRGHRWQSAAAKEMVNSGRIPLVV